jgi:hypothetical protein
VKILGFNESVTASTQPTTSEPMFGILSGLLVADPEAARARREQQRLEDYIQRRFIAHYIEPDPERLH